MVCWWGTGRIVQRPTELSFKQILSATTQRSNHDVKHDGSVCVGVALLVSEATQVNLPEVFVPRLPALANAPPPQRKGRRGGLWSRRGQASSHSVHRQRGRTSLASPDCVSVKVGCGKGHRHGNKSQGKHGHLLRAFQAAHAPTDTTKSSSKWRKPKKGKATHSMHEFPHRAPNDGKERRSRPRKGVQSIPRAKGSRKPIRQPDTPNQG